MRTLLILALLSAQAAAADTAFNGVPLREEADLQSARRSAPPAAGELVFVSGRIGKAMPGLQYLAPVGRDAALCRVDDPARIPPGTLMALPTPAMKRGRDLSPQASKDGRTPRGMTAYFAGDGQFAREFRAAFPAAKVSAPVRRGALGRIGIREEDNPEAAIDWLCARPEVYFVQGAWGARLLLPPHRRIVQSGTTASGGETLWARGLRGEGQTAAVLDTGLDVLNCFFTENDASLPPVGRGLAIQTPDNSRRKVTVYNMLYSGDDPADGLSAYENQGHGTHVAGDALGSARTDPFDTADSIANGVAPATKLVVQDGGFDGLDACSDLAALDCPVSIDFDLVFQQAYAQGARLHNNSWGDREDSAVQNDYSAACADFDRFVWEHPDFFIVCAAGNAGPGFDTVSSPSVSKNVLSVGALQNPNFDSMAGFSSRGWAIDGRIKPDITAPGQSTASIWDEFAAAEHCDTGDLQGTSMASPIAMGAAALVRQYFTEGWHKSGSANAADAFEPSAALLRATLTNGAVRVANITALPPSRSQGWGRVQLENTLYFGGADRRLLVRDSPASFSASTDGPYELEFTCDGATDLGNIVVTLAWTDYPALPGASPALVNDLDLAVESPGGTVFLANVFDSGTGLSLSAGAADTVNNVETARLAPAAGTFKITVTPSAIVEGPQSFAIAISGPVAEMANASTELWTLM